MIVADILQIPLAGIRVVNGDTAAFPTGFGSFASRAAVVAGNAVRMAAIRVKERALTLASRSLEVHTGDLELADGAVRVKGYPSKAIALGDLAEAAETTLVSEGAGDSAGRPGLEAAAFFDAPRATWGSGVHGCEVEVDVQTGRVSFRGYAVVHDCGTVLNPAAVRGQILGGVAQGIGGSLYEHIVYDAEGQLKNSNFMDFVMPYATEVPDVQLDHLVSVSPSNQLGARGVGEAGVIPVAAATASAVENALSDLGVRIVQMPLSPGQIRGLVEA
jgi:CO/xanthine dehydrogenase Mo-binding subunit